MCMAAAASWSRTCPYPQQLSLQHTCSVTLRVEGAASPAGIICSNDVASLTDRVIRTTQPAAPTRSLALPATSSQTQSRCEGSAHSTCTRHCHSGRRSLGHIPVVMWVVLWVTSRCHDAGVVTTTQYKQPSTRRPRSHHDPGHPRHITIQVTQVTS
jgi:hypothetical protein